MMDPKAFADSLVDIVRGFVTKTFAGIQTQIDAINSRFANLPAPKDGKDADPAAVAALVDASVIAAVKTLRPPKDGASVTVDDVKPMVANLVDAAVAALPLAVPGKDADPAAVAALVDAAVKALPAPKDGASVTVDDVKPLVVNLVADAVKALPAPKDGASVTVDDVKPVIVAEVARAVEALPAPKDGASVTVEQLQPTIAAECVRAAAAFPVLIRNLVDEAVADLPAPKDGASVTVDDVKPIIATEVARAVAELPPATPGKDADPAAVAALVDAAVKALPAPKDGASVTVDDVKPVIAAEVARAVEALPPATPGKDADPKAVAALVDAAVKALPAPKDGASVTVDDVKPVIAAEVARHVEALPAPKDGKSVPIEDVQRMVDEAVAKAIAAIQLPKNEPGRDAAQIEILPAIDAAKSYPRGTYATHAGGLWRAFEATSALKGWECIIDGIADVEIKQDPKEPRVLFVGITRSSGKQSHEHMQLPVMIYRGVFKEGTAYVEGDLVTWAGSLWHCGTATVDKPATSNDWKLCAKAGRDGKDAIVKPASPKAN